MLRRLICKLFGHKVDYDKVLKCSEQKLDYAKWNENKCLICKEDIKFSSLYTQFSRSKASKKREYSIKELKLAMRKADNERTNLFNKYL